MKSQFVLTLVSFLLLALAIKPLLADPDPLLDRDGNEVVATRTYYVVSGEARLTLVPRRNHECPADVAIGERRIPIFFRTYKNTSVIYEAMDLNVDLFIIGSCNGTKVSKVDDYDESRGKWFITTDAFPGNPGAQTLLNWFKFEKYGELSRVYKIVYCSSVCESCVHLCKNIGISFADGAWRLVLLPDDEVALPFEIIQAKGKVSIRINYMDALLLSPDHVSAGPLALIITQTKL